MATYKGVVPYGKYTFYPATQTIEFNNDYSGLALSDIMLITNVKSGTAITIYDPFDPAKGGTLNIISSVITLTLNYDTTAMSNTDPLQVIVGMTNLPTALPTDAATETTLSTINGKIPSGLTVTSTRLLTDGSGVTQPVSLLSLPSLAAGSNTIGSIANTSFGISGTLPAFAAIPTFKIDQTTPGTTNKVDIGTNGTVAISGSVSVTGPLTDTQLRASAVPVSLASVPTHAVTQSGTWTVATNADGTTGSAVPSKGLLVQGSDGTNARNLSTTTGGILKVDLSGTAANTTAIKVDGSAVTQPVSGSLTTVSTVTNLVQMNGAAIAMGTGVRTAGTQRVTIATDDSVPVTGTFWQATQPVSIAASVAVTGPLTDTQLRATPVPISGTITANIGTAGTLALESGGNLASIKTNTDNIALTQGSTTSGQKGNLIMAAVTTSNPSYTTAQTSSLSLNTLGELRVGNDGCTAYQTVSSTGQNLALIKLGATKVYGWYIYNNAAYPKKVILYDAASTGSVTVGTTVPLVTLVIPASSGANVSLPVPLAVSSGLCIAMTGGAVSSTTMQNNDTTNVTLNDLNINILYK